MPGTDLVPAPVFTISNPSAKAKARIRSLASSRFSNISPLYGGRIHDGGNEFTLRSKTSTKVAGQPALATQAVDDKEDIIIRQEQKIEDSTLRTYLTAELQVKEITTAPAVSSPPVRTAWQSSTPWILAAGQSQARIAYIKSFMDDSDSDSEVGEDKWVKVSTCGDSLIQITVKFARSCSGCEFAAEVAAPRHSREKAVCRGWRVTGDGSA